MPQDGFPRARAAAERAIALDPDIPDAHVSICARTAVLGPRLARCRAGDEAGHRAESEAGAGALVLLIDPDTTGRFDEALAEAQLATELDPLSLVINMSVAWVHHFSGNHRAAVDEARRIRELAPNFAEAGNVLIASYELLGRFEEAAALISEQPYFGISVDGSQLLAAYREGGAAGYWRKRLELWRRWTASHRW